MISVLYVDDEPALLDIAKLFLEKNGELTVDTVPSAHEAIRQLQHRTYDAIVSDYQMPGMDGIAFLQHVRFGFDQIPFILFTGRGREEVVIEALNNGADFYLQKGSDPKAQFRELEHKIRHAVYRRRAEVQLQQSEKRMADIINFLPDATFAIDPKGHVIAWNRAIEEMTGVAAGDIVGRGDFAYALPFYGERRRTLIDLVLKCDRGYSQQQYSSISRSSTGIVVETEYAHPRGRNVVLWAKAAPLYDEHGNLIGAIESIRDITALKAAQQDLEQKNEELMAANEQLTAAEEEIRQQMDELVTAGQALRQSDERFRSIYWWTQDVVIFHAPCPGDDGDVPDFLIADCNPAFEQTFGIPREKAVGMRASGLYADRNPSDREIYHSVAETRKSVRFETYCPREERHFSVCAVPVGEGGFATMSTDITDRIAFEKALLAKTEDLEAANQHLTAMEEELRQQMDDLAAAHDEIRRSETRYRAVVEEQTEMICRFTPGFIFSFANEAFCRFFGKKREDFLKRRIDPAFIHPDDIGRIRIQLEALTAEHPDVTVDQRVMLSDGVVRWVKWNIRGLYFTSGEIFGYQAVGRDITDYLQVKHAVEQRYRFEKTLAAVSSRFITHASFDAAVNDSLRDIGVLSGACRAYLFLLDGGGNSISNTHEWCGEGVVSERDALQNLPCDMFPWWMARLRNGEIIVIPDVSSLPEEACAEREILESQSIQSVLVLPVQIRGELIGFIGLDNVTCTREWCPEDAELLRMSSELIGSALERKRMEDALREREAHFQFLVNHSSDIFLIVNPDATIRYVSPVVATITGYPAEECTGSIFDHAHPDDAPLLRRHWNDMIRNRTASFQFDYRAIHKYGNLLYFEGLGQNYLDDPSIHGIIVNIRDVTGRKRTERAVQEANRKLHLLSSVTRHDILNQVTVQLGYAEIAGQSSSASELCECIRNFERSARTIQRQIEFTRDYQNLGIKNPVWISISDVLAKVREPHVVIHNDLWGIEIFGDPLLEKVFENLLDNTIRHGTNATTVRVSYRISPDGLTILWEDDGTGIPDSQKELIFERGYGRNTGLGLYLSREILAITGIALRETGTFGEGARFEISVPNGAYTITAAA